MTATVSPSLSADDVRGRRQGWLGWLPVLLLVVGLGAGFVVGRVTKPETPVPSDLAGTEVTSVLDEFMAAVNSGDEARIADVFAPDAVLSDVSEGGGDVATGNSEIAADFATWQAGGFRLWDPGTAIRHGDFVAQYHVSSTGPVMAVYQLDGDRIQHMWVVGEP
jgi:hypothetical protein